MIAIMKFDSLNGLPNYNVVTRFSSIDEIRASHKRYYIVHNDNLVCANAYEKELAKMTVLIFEWKHSGHLNKRKKRLQRAVYCIVKW